MHGVLVVSVFQTSAWVRRISGTTTESVSPDQVSGVNGHRGSPRAGLEPYPVVVYAHSSKRW